LALGGQNFEGINNNQLRAGVCDGGPERRGTARVEHGGGGVVPSFGAPIGMTKEIELS
jgi:hypothetical protein